MAPSALQQRRTHNLLLLQKLLNLRDGASPFTLVLDTLEQSARPVLKEFASRAKISKTKVVFISFQTLRKPQYADVFIRGHRRPLAALRKEILSHVIAANPTVTAAPTKTLLILDTLQTLADTVPEHLPTFLSSLLGPSISVLAIFHIDVPLTIQKSSLSHHVYAPDPLTTLCYLATAILRVSNLSHVIARKKARDRSLQEPDFGVSEGREGVLAGIGGHEDGVVVDMEVRRKSGRGVKEVFVFGALAAQRSPSEAIVKGGIGSKICLLDDHPLYARPADVVSGVVVGAATGEGDEPETTFSLGLTEKQRRDREGVVLPYFDAQTGEGPGEGGRILYEMGREDDYDEDEDDEI